MRKIGLLCLVAMLSAACSHTSRLKDGETTHTSNIVSALQQRADLVTTEVTLRKIAIYDTSRSERFSWTNPKTWRYGEKKCIVPVEVRIKYGYDLRQLSVSDVKISDEQSAVWVRLPKPKVIDSSYNTYIDEGAIVKMSTGLRSDIGHELEEEIRRKAYESVMQEDLSDLVGDDVERNAQTIFTGLLNSMGYKQVSIVTAER